MNQIYLDYNATTPVSPPVMHAMLPWFAERFWNPASSHVAGRSAAAAVEGARAQVARLIGASSSREVIWTSGATEANNLAIKGAVEGSDRSTVVVSATEHKAVLDTADDLRRRRIEVRRVAVHSDGTVDQESLIAALDESVAVVSVMLANNETGVIQPLEDVVREAHRWGCLVHTDATQAIGKINVDVTELGVDLMSMSAHKFYGPKGVGALYVRRGTALHPQIHGGGHEFGARSGTINVPAVIGLGAAAEESVAWLASASSETHVLTERLYQQLCANLPGVEWLGKRAERLPNTANLRFAGADAEAVMVNAPNLAISSGSACSASVPEPSHVVQAMGLDQEEAYECLRFSLGRPTTAAEVDLATDTIIRSVQRVRALNEAEITPPRKKEHPRETR